VILTGASRLARKRHRTAPASWAFRCASRGSTLNPSPVPLRCLRGDQRGHTSERRPPVSGVRARTPSPRAALVVGRRGCCGGCSNCRGCHCRSRSRFTRRRAGTLFVGFDRAASSTRRSAAARSHRQGCDFFRTTSSSPTTADRHHQKPSAAALRPHPWGDHPKGQPPAGAHRTRPRCVHLRRSAARSQLLDRERLVPPGQHRRLTTASVVR
jgi:hypothetical protein